MTGVTPIQTFRTSAQDQRSLLIWQRFMSEVYFKLEIQPGNDDVIVGSLAKKGFAQATISSLDADDHRVVRSRQLALDDNVESFCLVFPMRGTFEYRQHGRECKAGAGEIYILNAQEPYEVDLSQHARMLCLSLPCDLLRSRVCNIDDLCGSDRFAEPMLASTLSHVIGGVLDAVPRIEPETLQSLCLDLVSLMILPDHKLAGRSYAESIAATIVAKARRIIRLNLSKPGLNVIQAAAACHVSVRQMQAAFQRQETTFGAELLEERLLAASRLLRHSSEVPRLIGAIAMDCGFLNQSHFTTRYKERFGRTPREERLPRGEATNASVS